MPNVIAYAALVMWPLVTLALFLLLPLRRAIVWSLLGAYMLLPVKTSFDMSLVPSLDKTSIPNIVTFVMALVFARRAEFRWPRSTAINVLMALYLLTPFGTSFFNGDSYSIGDVVMPALTFKDGVSVCLQHAIDLLPFILGCGFFYDERSQREILLAFVLAGLAYSLPILAEMRLSPILALDLYGIKPGTYFAQQIREGGYRAMVFMGHGLLVSTFIAMALLAAAGLWRTRRAIWGIPASLLTLYLFAILVLNKSLGAIILAAIIVPALYFVRPRRFVMGAFMIAAIIMAYPAARGLNLVPVHEVVALVGKVDADRAHSFSFRLKNEELLLSRANQRPVFGWGGYGRNRLFVQENWGAVIDTTITDGTWIITVGTLGWAGYIALFGLLCYPFWRALALRNHALSLTSVTLIAMHLLNLIDLIPNSSLRPITFLVAGALSGLAAVRVSRAAPRPWQLMNPLHANAAQPG